jgi:hypothetical protein
LRTTSWLSGCRRFPPIPPIGPFSAAQDAVTAEMTLAAAVEPSTTDVGEPGTPGNAFKATGKETAPGQLAKQPTVAETDETIAPRIKKYAYAEPATSTSGAVQAQGEVRETGASTKKADGTTNVSPKKKADKGDTAETAMTATDSTPKKGGTPKKDRTDNE